MITSFAGSTTTADGTEQSLAAVNVQGQFTLFLDTSNMAAGDVLELRAYKIALTGGTKRIVWQTAFYDAQSAPMPVMKQSPTIQNELTDTNSIQFTLKQTLGTNRAYAWVCLKDDALTPTTSGRTLDVATTGEAGIDFNNISDSGAVESGLTVINALRLLAAAEAGKLSGAGTTTIVIRNSVADSKNRITATVDASGNRSAITYDLT